MDITKLSKETDLTLAQAKAEFIELTRLYKDSPPGGWMRHINITVGDRLDFLRRTITDFVIKD